MNQVIEYIVVILFTLIIMWSIFGVSKGFSYLDANNEPKKLKAKLLLYFICGPLMWIIVILSYLWRFFEIVGEYLSDKVDSIFNLIKKLDE